jgi:hypothetical protein
LGGWLPFQSCSCGVKKEQIEVWRWNLSLSLIDEIELIIISQAKKKHANIFQKILLKLFIS